MAGAPHWHFAAFRLDLDNACVWHGAELLALRPKTFAVLHHLVAHAGQLVTKAALLEAVWPQTAVSDTVLKDCMYELRQALGDTARTPQCIATVHRRGYRFIPPVTVTEPAPATEAQAVRAALRPALISTPYLSPASGPALTSSAQLVARETELATLHQWFAKAMQGERQLGFITGEPGIGKTTLVDTFVTQLAGQGPLWLGHGQCIEQYGTGEAYLPLLEALGQMGRAPGGPHLVTLLHQQAPSWLLQLPALLSPAEYEAMQRYAGGTTRERMLRELAEAVEVLTATRPCVLVLEDLHWSDTATIEWLAYVARRREPARLLLLGTYRPVDALIRSHPVRAMVQELMVHGHGAELPLGEWSEACVAAYLAQRGAGAVVPVTLARVLTARTDGYPLFLVAVVDELLRQGRLQAGPAGWELIGGLDAVMGAVPPSIRRLLEHQVAQLCSTDQELLAAASVAGVEFAVAAVAAAVAQTDEAVEAQFDVLAHQHHLVLARGTAVWPDGTLTARYGFRHALYQELLYERVPVGRRLRWHQQIGARLEAGYALQARSMAAELAEHFGRGHDAHRAVHYLQQAAENAARRYAHHEVIGLLTRAVALLQQLPETPERTHLEIELQLGLGPVLITTKGHAASEVEQTYARALVLCQQVGETPQRFPTLQGLCLFYHSRGEFVRAREAAEQLDQLAQCVVARAPRQAAHDALGTTLFFQGEFVAARWHLGQAIALTDPARQRAQAFRDIETSGVKCLVMAAQTLWCLGYPTQAVQRSQEALAFAQEIAQPYSLTTAQHFAAFLYYRRREALAVQAQAEPLIALTAEQGFPVRLGMGHCWLGWALAMQEQGEAGIAHLHQGMAAVMATEVGSRPLCLLLLAEAMGVTGQVEEGLLVLAEALLAFEASGRCDLLAEAYRLQGVLLLRQPGTSPTEAEACFQYALDVARRQQAKSLELRAAMSLSRLWQQQGKHAEARELLAPIYGWFTEGFDTADLQEAKALLEELEG